MGVGLHRVVTVFATGIIVLASTGVATGSSVGYPAAFWDANNDGQVNGSDASVATQSAGTGWNTTRTSTAQRAVAEWRDRTHYNPTFSASTGPVNIYVDGRDPYCSSPWSQLPSGIVALTCIEWTLREYPGGLDVWLDIHDATVYHDTNSHFWTFGTNPYDPSDPRLSFEGVLVHELGHVAGLDHESGSCASPIPTMCAGVTTQQTHFQESLETVDINSVNNRY